MREPDATERDVMDPDVMDPDAIDPDAIDPDVMEPYMAVPDVMAPYMMQPDAARLDATRLDATRPDRTRPGEARPGEARPGEARPGEARPGEARPGEARPEVARALAEAFDIFRVKLAELAGAIRERLPRAETTPLFLEVDRTTVWMTRLTRFVSARTGHSFAPDGGGTPASTVLETFRAKAAMLSAAVRRGRPRAETSPLFWEVDRATVWMGRLTSYLAAHGSPGCEDPTVRDAPADDATAHDVPAGGGEADSVAFRPPDYHAVARAVMSAPRSAAPRSSDRDRDLTDEFLRVLVGIPARGPRPAALPGAQIPRPQIPPPHMPPDRARPERARPDRARPEARDEAARAGGPGPRASGGPSPERARAGRSAGSPRPPGAARLEAPGPVGAAQALDTVDTVDPVDAVDTVHTVDPVDTVDMVDTVDTVRPVDPVDPVDPVGPADRASATDAPEARATSRPPAGGDGRAPGPRAGRGRDRDPPAGGEGPAGARYVAGIGSGAEVSARAADADPRPDADGRADRDPPAGGEGPRPDRGDCAHAARAHASDAGGARGGNVMTTGPPGECV